MIILRDFIYIYMLENQDDGTQIGAPLAVRSDFAGGDSTVGVVSVGSTYEQTFENLDKIKEHHKKVGSLITVPVEVTVQVTKNGISLGKQQQTRYFAADSTRDTIYADNTLSRKIRQRCGIPFKRVYLLPIQHIPYLKRGVFKT